MAKMKFFELFGPNKLVVNYIYFDQYVQLSDGYTTKRAIFEDSIEGTKLVLSGKGFEYDMSGDTLIAGTITAIFLKNAQGENYLSLSDLKANVAGFYEAYDQGHPDFLLAYLLRAKDTLTGSNIADTIDGYAGRNTIHGGGGADTLQGNDAADRLFGDGGNDALFGAGGNDTMTGGKGSDIFWFTGVTGDDVITDFDAKGGGNLQDYLKFTELTEFTIKRAGDDVLITFADGDSIRLLDVAMKDFSADTDMQFPVA